MKMIELNKINKHKFEFYKINIDLDFSFFDIKIWKIAIIILGLVSLIVANVFYFQVTIKLILIILSIVCFAIFPIINIIINILSKRYLCDSMFVVLSGILSFLAGNKTSCALIVLFYDIFKFTECFLWNDNTSKLKSAIDLLPEYATVAMNGKATKIKPSRLRKGDIVCVYQNEIVPIDGTIINGSSILDYKNLNCDNCEIEVNKNSKVLSGGINLQNPIIILADCDYSDSFAKKIFDICDNSINDSTKQQKAIQPILNYYIPVMFIITLILSVIVPLFKHDWSNSLNVASALILLMCPFGVGSLLYKFFYTSIVQIFNHGVILSSGSIIEIISNVKTIICNKTSTVTERDYIIEDVNPEGITIDNFLSLVLNVESISKHPMAEALRNYCNIDYVEVPSGLLAKEIPGKGIEALLNNTSILVGNASLLFEHNVTTKVPDKQGSVIYVSVNNTYCGYILYSNKIRKSAFNVIEKLISSGINSFVLLSCDLRSVVRPIANTLGFTVIKSEIEPSDKASITDYFIDNSTGNSSVLYLGNEHDEIDASKHADISMSSDAIRNKDILSLTDVVSIGSGFVTLPYLIKYSILCTFMSKVLFLLFVISRIIFTLLSLFLSVNAMSVLITIFLVSILTLISAEFLYKRVEV